MYDLHDELTSLWGQGVQNNEEDVWWVLADDQDALKGRTSPFMCCRGDNVSISLGEKEEGLCMA